MGLDCLMMASVTKILRKSWGESMSGSPLVLVRPIAASVLMSSLRIAMRVNGRFSLPMERWNSSGIGGFQTLVGRHERYPAVGGNPGRQRHPLHAIRLRVAGERWLDRTNLVR